MSNLSEHHDMYVRKKERKNEIPPFLLPSLQPSIQEKSKMRGKKEKRKKNRVRGTGGVRTGFLRMLLISLLGRELDLDKK